MSQRWESVKAEIFIIRTKCHRLGQGDSASALFLTAHTAVSADHRSPAGSTQKQKEGENWLEQMVSDTAWDKGARGSESSLLSLETHWMLRLLRAFLSAHHCQTFSQLCHAPELREV